MTEEALKQVLSAVLGIPAESIGEATSMDTVEGWDSIKHMNLVLALEDEFGISIPDEDAANITSYPLIRLVLGDLVAR
jgi:acyl carrier protein